MLAYSRQTLVYSKFWFVLSASVAAFSTYFCMYAFRKPFVVAGYSEAPLFFGIDFKSALVIAQVLGYAVSKFIGIKVISEMTPARRSGAILSLVMLAQLALVLFAVLPQNAKVVALFFNGLPLGMIWGLVFSYLEGRKTTEILAAILSVSFIISSGVVKSVGLFLIQETQVTQYWMPAVTGALFIIPLLLSVLWLARVPPPDDQDISARKLRVPMSKSERYAFLNRYFTGLTCLTLSYMLLTVLRDFSDNFANEIWQSLGYGNTPAIFSVSALYSSFMVLVLLGSIVWIKSNFKALMINHFLIIAGFAGLSFFSLLYEQEIISGITWMTALTVSIYLAYIPFNCIIFERIISLVRYRANAGFLIYIADAMGYIGSVVILLYRQHFESQRSWERFLIDSTYFTSLAGTVLMLGSIFYFYHKLRIYRFNPSKISIA